MILKYHITVDDLVAFNRYHCALSPAIRKMKFTTIVLVAVLLIGGSFVMPLHENGSRLVVVASAVVFVVLFSVLFSNLLPASLDRHARRLYKEGTNRGVLGEHELECDDRGLVERTEVNESRQSWQGVERIAETESHAFIYISAMMAHVIPKASVTSGDPGQFLTQARQLWTSANAVSWRKQDQT